MPGTYVHRMPPAGSLELPPPGARFGRWTLVDAPPESRVRRGRWSVRCDCGTETTVLHYNLRKGTSVMCRACCVAMKPLLTKARGLRPPPPTASLALPEAGTCFGDWTLIAAPPESNKRRGRWLVRCSCGREDSVLHYNLRKGISTCCRACGARRRATTIATNLPQQQHGESRRRGWTREHQTWCRIRARCYTPGAAGYENYGARGIRVCSRWLGTRGFVNFLADMGRRPGAGWSIERVDVNGNYEPGNCRWLPNREQSRNTRSNVRITVAGDTRILTDWVRAFGVSASTIKSRIARGWDTGRAVSQPTCKR